MHILLNDHHATLQPATLYGFAPASCLKTAPPRTRPLLLVSDAFLANPVSCQARCRDTEALFRLCAFLNDCLAGGPEVAHHLLRQARKRKSRLPGRYAKPLPQPDLHKRGPALLFIPSDTRSGRWQVVATHARGRVPMLTSFADSDHATRLADSLNARMSLPTEAWQTLHPAMRR